MASLNWPRESWHLQFIPARALPSGLVVAKKLVLGNTGNSYEPRKRVGRRMRVLKETMVIVVGD